MKKISTLFCARVLMSALCVSFVACHEPTETDPWLGKEIPGMETQQATGAIIGSYSNGFISILVQVDEEFPIGKTIDDLGTIGDCLSLPAAGTYKNMIQVQYSLPINTENKISFSFREYNNETDLELFQWGAGNTMCAAPNVPVCVITEYKILNN